jgi:hypothetical protein
MPKPTLSHGLFADTNLEHCAANHSSAGVNPSLMAQGSFQAASPLNESAMSMPLHIPFSRACYVLRREVAEGPTRDVAILGLTPSPALLLCDSC